MAAAVAANLGKWVTLWEDMDDKFGNIEGTWRNKTNIESSKDESILRYCLSLNR